jgi:hypothetical protein
MKEQLATYSLNEIIAHCYIDCVTVEVQGTRKREGKLLDCLN